MLNFLPNTRFIIDLLSIIDQLSNFKNCLYNIDAIDFSNFFNVYMYFFLNVETLFHSCL